MRLLFFVGYFVTLNFTGYSQIHFEKGYYVNNNGERVDGFIKNIGWKNNPYNFAFKSSESAEDNNITIDSVKEFSIVGGVRYKRFDVYIDRSSNNVQSLSKVREPEFSEETLFLEVLLEGEASLYAYEEGNLKRYFYTTGTSPIEQLIYKKYRKEFTDYKTAEYGIYSNNRISSNYGMS